MVSSMVILDTYAIESEEILIDFCELIGEHSGVNMAATVWETLQKYRLTGRVKAIL